MAALRHQLIPRLLGLLALISFLAAAATAEKTGEVTVFWGRNKEEGTLRETCDTSRYTTVVISFYSVFGHGRYWGDLSGHPLPGVGDDIDHCKSMGITVLLSIGGGGDQYSLPSSQSAADVAYNLWNAHLIGTFGSGVFRPFGGAFVNGIDFFIDQGSPDHYDELARHLRSYDKEDFGGPGVLLTATPRCGFPDRRMAKALQTGLFSRIHVRFYDDPDCSYNHAGVQRVMQHWDRWTAAYPDNHVLLGLPAANLPGKNDMVDHKALYHDLLPKVQKAGNYGGVMLWDRYYDKQTNYSRYMKYLA